ncbi:uncharacterized protein LOC129304015 isoform X1 [Prosopis cineraria]|uniref:uncharacterized protein LOC129304015 isoform X1 n=1 Tax=Prosopis cineraria TaxID=364024 RepID=UPI00240EDFB9|nr:uncharacterized protein LOC129304015 isoform X1 [Prosopis cineraria]
MEDSKTKDNLVKIFDLLNSAGYLDATKSYVPPAEKLAGGLAWCIATLNPSVPPSDPRRGSVMCSDAVECIEEALRLVGCPHPLKPSHIHHLDSEFIFPVIQWLVGRVQLKHDEGGNEVFHSENPVGEDEHTHRQCKQEVAKMKNSTKILRGNLDEMKLRKMNAVNKLKDLRERISNKGAETAVQKLVVLLKSLKDLERQENHFLSNRDAKHSEIQAEISELEGKIANGCDSKILLDGLRRHLSESLENLDSAKKELATKTGDVVAIKRQIDYVPCQSELIQYELRFSELYALIQGRHSQTRKCYATYNALLEIKELMLKETSLLNSIILQFQEAFSSPDGRMKLVKSMEGIVKGSQQKLEKVQIGLREEERNLDDVKERYAAAVGAQKRCYSLMKAFQIFAGRNLQGGETWASNPN